MNSAVCTLFEGDYHLGVGALANSLHRFGFRGIMHVGYRGSLPSWMVGEKANPGSIASVPCGLSFRFHELDTPWHLTNYKPLFIKRAFDSDPTIDAIFYFDPDIVIKCQWTYYEEWVQAGIALVEEIATGGMPYNHPIRRRWLEVAKTLNIRCHPVFSQYFNAGFIGLNRSCEHYLDVWGAIISFLPKYGVDLSRFMQSNRPDPFTSADQDALNIVAMAAEPHLSTMGPEGMDFVPGGFTMSHAVGPKPWRKNYLLSAFNGMKPSLADKAFWDNTEAPIRVFSESQIFWRRFTLQLANLIGRFYGR